MRINTGGSMSIKRDRLARIRKIIPQFLSEAVVDDVVKGLAKAPSFTLGHLLSLLQHLAARVRALELENKQLKSTDFEPQAIRNYLNQVRVVVLPWEKECGKLFRKTALGLTVATVDPTMGGYVQVFRDKAPTQVGYEARSLGQGSWTAVRDVAASIQQAKDAADEFLKRQGLILLEDPEPAAV
jgi:hypothetical protein